MEVVKKEGGLPVFDIDILNTFFFFFCQLLNLLPGSQVKLAQIYLLQRG